MPADHVGGVEKPRSDSSGKRAARRLSDEKRQLAQLVGSPSGTKAAVVTLRTVREMIQWTEGGGTVACIGSDGKLSHRIDLTTSAIQHAIQQLDEELTLERS
jgi:hypothetical protein